MIGIIEVITLLMGLAGFSIGTNPKAPTAAQALEYAVADADIVAHLDATSLIPGNYKVLTQLQNQPQIKASPELAKTVRKALAEIDGPRGLLKSTTGIDVTTDVSDATAFVRFVPKQEPVMMVAVHGRFSTVTIDKIGKLMAKQVVRTGQTAWVDMGNGSAVGYTKTGVLLAGSVALVQERMSDAWKAPGLATGTSLGNAADVINSKPVFAFVLTMSPTARAEALAKIRTQNLASDLIKRHKLAAFVVYRDGVGWSWIDSTKPGLEAMAQMSDGLVELLRAAQIAPRGFAKLAMGALESYRGTSKQVDEVLKRKADIQKIVEMYTGDGQFKAQVDKDPNKLKLSVRLTGKSLSEVLPFGGLVPFGAIGWLTTAKEPPPPPSQIAVPPPAGKPPTKK